jgi:hypothetical protein
MTYGALREMSPPAGTILRLGELELLFPAFQLKHPRGLPKPQRNGRRAQ